MPGVTNHRLKDIVEKYKHKYRFGARAETLSYSQAQSLHDSIERAALSELAEGKRHPHQCRIPMHSLRQFARQLLAQSESLERVQSFAALHQLIADVAADVWKIDELTVYDTAYRIGAYLGLQPELVYLHRGTREGARALGFRKLRATLRRSDLPAEFTDLEPAEIEDCLCIFKNELRKLGSLSNGNSLRHGRARISPRDQRC